MIQERVRNSRIGEERICARNSPRGLQGYREIEDRSRCVSGRGTCQRQAIISAVASPTGRLYRPGPTLLSFLPCVADLRTENGRCHPIS
jgi:hypothetical protein